jgi:hypothetical protein
MQLFGFTNSKARATRRAKKGLPDSEPEDGEEAMETSDDWGVEEDLLYHPPSFPIPPPAKRKKSALVETTNQLRSSISKTAPSKPRTARKPLEKLAEVAASMPTANHTEGGTSSRIASRQGSSDDSVMSRTQPMSPIAMGTGCPRISLSLSRTFWIFSRRVWVE